MKRFALVMSLFLMSCIGNPPYNPMDAKLQRDCVDGMMFERKVDQPWWQLDTSHMKDSENPWNKFIPQHKAVNILDPWGSYNAPPLFPDGWTPAKISTRNSELRRLRKQVRLIKLRKKLKRQKQLEKKRLERLKRRSIINRQEERTY